MNDGYVGPLAEMLFSITAHNKIMFVLFFLSIDDRSFLYFTRIYKGEQSMRKTLEYDVMCAPHLNFELK